jgi:integrase
VFNRVIKKIRFHDLRHTHAMLGAGLKEVQERLGHVKTTGDVYAHVTKEMQGKTAHIFSDFMRKNG